MTDTATTAVDPGVERFEMLCEAALDIVLGQLKNVVPAHVMPHVTLARQFGREIKTILYIAVIDTVYLYLQPYAKLIEDKDPALWSKLVLPNGQALTQYVYVEGTTSEQRDMYMVLLGMMFSFAKSMRANAPSTDAVMRVRALTQSGVSSLHNEKTMRELYGLFNGVGFLFKSCGIGKAFCEGVGMSPSIE